MGELTIGMSVASEISMNTGKKITSWGNDIVVNGDMEDWPDVITDGGFDNACGVNWTCGVGWSVTGGKMTGAATVGNFNENVPTLVVGRTYDITFTVSDYSGGRVYARCGNGTNGTFRVADGTYTERLICTGNNFLIFSTGIPFTGKVDNVSAVLMDPDNWTVTENGTGTVSRSTINNGGIYSADLHNPAGGGNTVAIKQDQVGTIGIQYRLSVDVRCDTAVRTILIKSFDPIGPPGGVNATFNIALADTWYTATYEFTWGANDNAINISTNANGHYYIDNVKLESIMYTADKTMAMK